MGMEHWWKDTDRGKLKYWERNVIQWVVGEWMSMEHWWNDIDRGKLMYWERNIILRGWQLNEWEWSIGGIILTGETEVLGEKHYRAWVVDGWMSMEQWWNDTDRGN